MLQPLKLVKKGTKKETKMQSASPIKATKAHRQSDPASTSQRYEPRTTAGKGGSPGHRWRLCSAQAPPEGQDCSCKLHGNCRDTAASSFFKKKFQNKFNSFEVTSGRNQLLANGHAWGVTRNKRHLVCSGASCVWSHRLPQNPGRSLST